MATISERLAIANQHYQAGRFTEAEQAFRHVLEQQPDNSEIWHGLGMTYHRAGQLADAVNCYQKALSLKLDNPFIHNNLGVAFKAQRQFEDALIHYQQAIALKPDYPEVHNNLGNLYRLLGQPDQAIDHYQQAIALRSDYADARNNLGLALQDRRRFEDAIFQYQQILAVEPNDPDALNNLGNALQGLKRYTEAIGYYQKALIVRPNHPSYHNNLGAALQELGRLDESIQAYQTALQLNPNYPDAHYNLGNNFKEQKKLNESIACYQRAIALQPDYPDAYNNLGLVLCEQGQLDESIVAYQQAIALRPGYPDAHLNMGLSLLLKGDLRQGFEHYEWRWQVKGVNFKPPRPFAHPLWDGRDLNGQTILLHAEQGFGDSIQFIRYVPLVNARGGRVLVECQEPVLRLLRSVQGIDQLIPRGVALPAFDVHAPLMSLPRILGTTLETIPAQVPYLTAPEESSIKLEAPANKPFKVGIVWAGSPEHRGDRDRSCPFSKFSNLLEVSGVQFYSLQKGPRSIDLQSLEPGLIQDLGPQLHDFGDTAVAIQQLDLVITVDTSVGHVAGALGRPVWIILGFAADWRWMCDRSDSPWYPSVRLFRQRSPGDWDGVITQVMHALQAQAEGNSESLIPQSSPPPTPSPIPKKPVAIGWELSAATGWGVYGTNLALQLLRSSEFYPLAILPPLQSVPFNPLHRVLLQSVWTEHSRIAQILQQNPDKVLTGNFLLLKGLGNQFQTAETLERVRGKQNVGVIFFENTQLTQAALARAKTFDLILAGSTWNAEILRQHGLTHVRTVFQGIDPTMFHPAPRSGLFDDRFVVFSGGKLEYRKGQDIVIRAFREFQARHPEALLLTAWHNFWPSTMAEIAQTGNVVGLPEVNAEGQLQIQPWLIANGIPASACIDVGAIPNHLVGQIVREADVAVFPNRCEGGTNLAAMESLACGVPTILSANTGHLDLVQEQHCYPLRQQNPVTLHSSGTQGWGESSIEELVATLEFIYANRDDARRRGAKAAQFMQDWTWENQVGRSLQILRGLM